MRIVSKLRTSGPDPTCRRTDKGTDPKQTSGADHLAVQLIKELIDGGIHFGHRVSRWNPKMKPYIYGRRNLIHIINVKETLKGILLAKKFLAQTVTAGKDLLLVGTKRQARKAVQENALRVNMHYVNDRWLGGTLTNFREIRKRIGRLEQLEQSEAEGMLDSYSKKDGARLRREMRKIRRNLGGIRRMVQLPGALVVIDQRREIIAVREARKMGIPVICLLDTDGDPDLVDIPIPGNDDAMRSVELVLKELCDAIAEGVGARQAVAADREEVRPGAVQRRRSRRHTAARTKTVATTVQATEQPPQVPEQAPPVEPAPAEPAPAEQPADQRGPTEQTPTERPAQSEQV